MVPPACPRRTGELDSGKAIYLDELPDSSFMLSKYIKKNTLYIYFMISHKGATVKTSHMKTALSSPLSKRVLALFGDYNALVRASESDVVKAMRDIFMQRVKKCHMTDNVCPALVHQAFLKLL